MWFTKIGSPQMRVKNWLCPNEPRSNETLPHIEGHGGEDFSKHDLEPVRSITHLLEHVEYPTCGPCLSLSIFLPQVPNHSMGPHLLIPWPFHTDSCPSTRGGFRGECSRCKFCRMESIEVNQLPRPPPSPDVVHHGSLWFTGKSYIVLGRCQHLDQTHDFYLYNMFTNNEPWSWI